MFNQVNNVKNGKPISSILTEKFKPRRADTITIDMTIILMVLQETKPTRTRWIQPISRTHKHTHTHTYSANNCVNVMERAQLCTFPLVFVVQLEIFCFRFKCNLLFITCTVYTQYMCGRVVCSTIATM